MFKASFKVRQLKEPIKLRNQESNNGILLPSHTLDQFTTSKLFYDSWRRSRLIPIFLFTTIIASILFKFSHSFAFPLLLFKSISLLSFTFSIGDD